MPNNIQGANQNNTGMAPIVDTATIKDYFKKVLELVKSGEKFPVRLDDVWPLCFSSKGNAVKKLRNDFIEGVDYEPSKVFFQMEKNPLGGRPIEDYRISVPCMEFLVARKNREVFDIYRKVFHHTISNVVEETSLNELTKAKAIFVECAAKILNMNEVSKIQLLESNFSYLNPVLPSYAETKDATLSLTDLLNKFEIKTNAVEVNRILMEYGFIEHLERKSVSSKNGKKSFWKVSDKGLEFGENAVSPKSPNETRPRWFVSKFPELMKIIGLME